ncbi:MAG: hypothetical protein Tsb0010_04470 [Parvularculaceae bacterium]
MNTRAPWSVKGIEQDARASAKDAARRAGMTVGEWLNQAIYQASATETPDQGPASAALESNAHGGAKAGAAHADEIAALAGAVESLSAKIEAIENRSAGAAAALSRAVNEVAERIAGLEGREADFADGAMGDMFASLKRAQETLAARLDYIENSTDPGLRNFKVDELREAIAELADFVESRDQAARRREREAEARYKETMSAFRSYREETSAQLDRLGGAVETIEERLGGRGAGANRPPGVERERVERLEDRLEQIAENFARAEKELAAQATARSDAAEREIAALRSSVHDVLARLDAQESRIEEIVSARMAEAVEAALANFEAASGAQRGPASDRGALQDDCEMRAPDEDVTQTEIEREDCVDPEKDKRSDARQSEPEAPASDTPQRAAAQGNPIFAASLAADALSYTAEGLDVAHIDDGAREDGAATAIDEPGAHCRKPEPPAGAPPQARPEETDFATALAAATGAASDPKPALSEPVLSAPAPRALRDEARRPIPRPQSRSARRRRRFGSLAILAATAALIALAVVSVGMSDVAGWRAGVAAALADKYGIENLPGIGPRSSAAPAVEEPAASSRAETAPRVSDAAAQDVARGAAQDAAAVSAQPSSETSDPYTLYREATLAIDGGAAGAALDEAVSALADAAHRNYPPAQLALGQLYHAGDGVERNPKAAELWYERAAHGGNRRAMHLLAVLHARGDLGARDFRQAARWFENAARLDFVDSQYNLGVLYEQGNGVAQDWAQAYAWYMIAARNGDRDAAARADGIARRMTDSQTAAARALLEDWAPEPLDAIANGAAPPVAPRPGAGELAAPDTAPSDEIALVQALLARLGFDPGSRDGYMGPRTERAVREYERNAGLPETGRVTPTLVESLQSRIVDGD